MKVDYKHLYQASASMLAKYQDEIVPGFREVIQKQEAELNRRWIPVEEGMPPERDTIFNKFYGTPKWNDNMFRKMSDTVIVTAIDGKGQRYTAYRATTDGKFHNQERPDEKVIAWMPRPAPYGALEEMEEPHGNA